MSKSIKAILLGLRKEDQDQLNYAFENELRNQFVIYTTGRFIGVNIDPSLTSLVVEQTAGFYSEGTLVDRHKSEVH